MRDKELLEQLLFPNEFMKAACFYKQASSTMGSNLLPFSGIVERFSKAKKFVLSRDTISFEAGEKIEVADLYEEPISLPFPVCYFERLGGSVMGFESKERPEGGKIEFLAVIVSELAPNEFDVLSLQDSTGFHGFDHRVLRFPLGLESPPFERTLAQMILLIDSEIKNARLGTEKYNRDVVWTESTGKKCSHRINEIIRIGPKSSSNPEPVFAREVDWSHQWWVRGHWRRADGKIGKDRYGEYKIENYTWVTEHLKGPDDTQIIEKIRVVL